MSIYSTSIRETKVEFKSYGLYSDAAETLKKEGLHITVDQVEKIYNWYVKNIIASITEGESLQANLKNLGKIKFHYKKGMSTLNNQLEKLIGLLEYFDKINQKNLEPEDLEKRKYRIYLVLKKNYNKLLETSEAYFLKLEKIKANQGISEKQYEFQKERYNKLSTKLKELYEPVQRIFTAYEKRD
jgi:hypothetical protein